MSADVSTALWAALSSGRREMLDLIPLPLSSEDQRILMRAVGDLIDMVERQRRRHERVVQRVQQSAENILGAARKLEDIGTEDTYEEDSP